MILLLLLIALSIWGVVATVMDVRRDGFRATPTDWSRVAESDRAQAAPVPAIR